MLFIEIMYFRGLGFFYCSCSRLYIRAVIKLVGHNGFLNNQLCRGGCRERSGCGWSPCWCWEPLPVCPGNILRGPGHRDFSSITSPSLTGLPATQKKRGCKSHLLPERRGGAAYGPVPINAAAACGRLLLCSFSLKQSKLICFRVTYLGLDQKRAEKEAPQLLLILARKQ